jgi:molybdopterin-binding protein
VIAPGLKHSCIDAASGMGPLSGRAENLAAALSIWLYRYGAMHCRLGNHSKPTAGRRNVMKISARNIVKGKIVDVHKGATIANVRIDIGNGVVLTSSITNESVDSLGLAVGKDGYAIVKASEVMIGVD